MKQKLELAEDKMITKLRLSIIISLFCLTGDFAVLVRAGMSVKRAALLNALTALPCYFGAVVALLLGEYMEAFTPHIFSFVAGMMLYIALTDLVSISPCHSLIFSENVCTHYITCFLCKGKKHF